MKVFLETSSKQIEKKIFFLRPLDADEVTKRFRSFEKRIYLYSKRNDFKSLPSNSISQSQQGCFTDSSFPPNSTCLFLHKSLWEKRTEQLVTSKYQLNPDCNSEPSFSTVANTFNRWLKIFLNKWPITSAAKPELRLTPVWRMCMYIVKLHIILKDHQNVFNASEHFHWIPPQSFPEYQKYLKCFQQNKSGEGVQ